MSYPDGPAINQSASMFISLALLGMVLGALVVSYVQEYTESVYCPPWVICNWIPIFAAIPFMFGPLTIYYLLKEGVYESERNGQDGSGVKEYSKELEAAGFICFSIEKDANGVWLNIA